MHTPPSNIFQHKPSNVVVVAVAMLHPSHMLSVCFAYLRRVCTNDDSQMNPRPLDLLRRQKRISQMFYLPLAKIYIYSYCFCIENITEC